MVYRVLWPCNVKKDEISRYQLAMSRWSMAVLWQCAEVADRSTTRIISSKFEVRRSSLGLFVLIRDLGSGTLGFECGFGSG